MRFPYSWLKDYLPTKLSPQKMGELLTNIGLEVEKIDSEKFSGDSIFEVAITPNLNHCSCLLGIAKEVAPLVKSNLVIPHPIVKENKSEKIESLLQVEVEDKDFCPRYSARMIKDVSVGPSPEWLKKRLEECGFRSVNNVVDITNYVLLEYGHPLHAFDFDTLEGKKIVVRRAKKEEKIVSLDGQKRSLTQDTLVICDARKPIAIAGVMGSLNTEVTENTKTIVLEGAYFAKESIRRTSKRLGLITEASRRFERGVDPNGTLRALERACELIEKIAHGKTVSDVIDLQSQSFPPKKIPLRVSRVEELLGTNLALGEIESIFQKHDFSFEASGQTLIVEVPTYRVDISHEIDLIEEVARYYGFENLYHKISTYYQEGSLPNSPIYDYQQNIREQLVSSGLQEILTSDLISEDQIAIVAPDFSSRSFLRVLNPSSVQQSVLRTTFLPGMLDVVKKNADHGIDNLNVFETGCVHFKVGDNILEPFVASILITGSRTPYHFDSKPGDCDFFDLKGIVENLFEGMKLPSFGIKNSSYSIFHPFQQGDISVANRNVGIIGQVHPEILKRQGIKHRVYFAELNLMDLMSLPPREIKYNPFPRFPSSSRDLTLTIDITVTEDNCRAFINSLQEPLLEKVLLLDVYQSEKLGSERKNVTFRFIYRDLEKTLSHETVDAVHQEIAEKMTKAFAS